ncbi:MAG TPA: HDOD domain-containing protein [Bryobacteraceae bacterium]|nr:HDOD domain-containing protein [Bryobacteraceae bacterium]
MESSYQPALEAHCRRVAGWVTHGAQNLACSSAELRALEQAALQHHRSPVLWSAEAGRRFSEELGLKAEGENEASIKDAAFGVLNAFHGDRGAQDRVLEFAHLLECANIFDEQFELDAVHPQLLEESELLDDNAFRLRMVERSTVIRAAAGLPVFPTIAQRAMRLLLNDDTGFDHVESMASSDQTLAAELVGAANRAAVSPRQTIQTIGHAISHIGVDAATRIICAACIRPVFASRNLHDLWKHSVEAAHTAESLARASGRIAPGIAFFAGLIHDIGRLAFSLLSCEFQMCAQRLFEYGCPPLLVEQALAGVTHADIGADLLRSWAMSGEIANAVEWHHRLNGTGGGAASALAALLYLTEFQTASDEDLPSRSRLSDALQELALSPAALFVPKALDFEGYRRAS